MNPDEIRNIPEAKTLYGRLAAEFRNRTIVEIYLAFNKATGMSQNKYAMTIGITPAYFSTIFKRVRAGRRTPETA